MNQMTTRSTGTDLAAGSSKNAFEAYAESTSRNRIVGDLLKFSKGEYTAGQNGDEVEEGTQLVANMDELMIGWVKWEDSKPVDMIMGRVAEGYVPPKRAELGDTDEDEWEVDQGQPRDPWQLTNYLILKATDSDDLFTFATSSKGGLNAIGKLAGIFGKHMRQRPDQFPVIALNVDSYKHPNKAYGKIFTPKFDVVGWVGKEAFVEALAAADEASGEGGGEADEGPEIPFEDPKPATSRASGRSKAAAAETRF
ncbi:MAG TPA: hypothetical protein VHL98_10995 [Microvirga sp.]|jgi:hypothetical protein|nr:hypothetical protein [Microvirga sp.]